MNQKTVIVATTLSTFQRGRAELTMTFGDGLVAGCTITNAAAHLLSQQLQERLQPLRRLCTRCNAELTSADARGGRCTQCGKVVPR